MARSRNIKPGFFQNEELGDLTPIERLAFIGLWTVADFKGCIELKAKRLKIQLLPYDDCNIETIATNLERSRFIRIYSVQGQRYIKIINFYKHQNPHKNERDAGSEIPDMPDDYENINEINELTQDGTKPDLIGTTRADSLFLIPDSLSLIPDCSASDKDAKKDKTARGSRLPQNFEPDFQFAVDAGIANTLEEASKFRDYWNAQPGQKGVKLDWAATWRNWCRNAKPSAKVAAAYESPYAKSMREKFEIAAPSVAARSPEVQRINPNTYFEDMAKNLAKAKNLEIANGR